MSDTDIIHINNNNNHHNKCRTSDFSIYLSIYYFNKVESKYLTVVSSVLLSECMTPFKGYYHNKAQEELSYCNEHFSPMVIFSIRKRKDDEANN